MNPGKVLILIPLVFSLLLSLFSFLNPQKYNRIVKVLILLTFAGITSAFLFLTYLQFQHNFQYVYVFSHTSIGTPTIYLLSATWSGKEGTLLTLTLINTWIGLIFKRQIQNINIKNRTFWVFSIINTILIITSFINNPFKTFPIAPAEGLGLTPALQNPWLILHPPLVFIGYSAMAVLFTLSITTNYKNTETHSLIRKWILISSLFLGGGILTGSIWAEYALGWGRFWSWDPVENTALVTWLTLIAFLHSPSYIKIKQFHHALPFALAVCSIILTRSGILQGKSLLLLW